MDLLELVEAPGFQDHFQEEEHWADQKVEVLGAYHEDECDVGGLRGDDGGRDDGEDA